MTNSMKGRVVYRQEVGAHPVYLERARSNTYAERRGTSVESRIKTGIGHTFIDRPHRNSQRDRASCDEASSSDSLNCPRCVTTCSTATRFDINPQLGPREHSATGTSPVLSPSPLLRAPCCNSAASPDRPASPPTSSAPSTENSLKSISRLLATTEADKTARTDRVLKISPVRRCISVRSVSPTASTSASWAG